MIRAADPGSKYLAAEYARNLIHVFGGIERLVVIPRARVLMAEATDEMPVVIGRALPATHVLLAVVRAMDDAFVFSAELVESRSNRKRWHETIRASLADGAGFPGEVARALMAALHLPPLNRNEREQQITTANPAARRAYLNGRRALDTLTEPSLLESIGHFERAISADPNFAAARVGLATAHIALGYNFRNPRIHFTQARETLARAPAAKTPLAEAVTAEAYVVTLGGEIWKIDDVSNRPLSTGRIRKRTFPITFHPPASEAEISRVARATGKELLATAEKRARL